MATVERALAELEEEPEVPEGETSLQLLQAIYKDKKQPLNVRVRCAIEALPFEVSKLSAAAIATMDGKSFAEALDRAIARSQSPVPLLNGPVQELPASELRKPFSNYRNNYRRYCMCKGGRYITSMADELDDTWLSETNGEGGLFDLR